MIALGKINKAEKILNRISRVNGKKVNIDHTSIELIQKSNQTESTESNNIFLVIYNDLITPKRNFFKMIALLIISNSVIFNYIGLTYGITTLIKINPYASYLLSSFFEFLGIVFCHLNDYLGRKKALLIQLLISSVAFLTIAILPADGNNTSFTWALMAKFLCFLITKMMISASFNTIYVYTSELYEIKVRSTALTIIMSLGGLSSFIVPQVNALEKPIPYFIYSSAGFISALILCTLPETYSKMLNKGSI